MTAKEDFLKYLYQLEEVETIHCFHLNKIREKAGLAIVEEREECAKIADFWASDLGLSPCHGDGLRFGLKVTGTAIAEAIRKRGMQ